MNLFLLFITFVTLNSCLELKFLKKTEFFSKGCDSDVIEISIEKLKKGCNPEQFTEINCK